LISGGTNHISNRVLACASCNGDEKRESDWIEFLRGKTSSELEFRSRREHIQLWCSSHAPKQPRLIDAEVQAEIDRALEAFDIALANLRRLRKAHSDDD